LVTNFRYHHLLPRKDEATPVSDRYWNIFGMLLVLSVLVAAHPLRPSAAAAVEEHLVTAWQKMADSPLPCDGFEVGCATALTMP
jgi:hypothetical protein